MKKTLFSLAALFLFAVLAVYLNQEKDLKPKINVGSNSYMDEVSMTQKKAGVVSWILDAKKAVFLNDTDIKLADLRIVFPEKGLTLTSEGGLYDMEKRKLKIEGKINASTDSYDIVASSLFWDSSKNEVMSDEKVQIIGKRFSVEGEHLTATNDKAKLTKNVRAVFDGK